MRLIVAIFVSTVAVALAMAAGNATDGQRDFSRCAACHSIQQGKDGIAPSLTGIVGRQSQFEGAAVMSISSAPTPAEGNVDRIVSGRM